MSESQDLDVDIENAEDDTTVVVTDSENYGETQRLKQIYKLRSDVQDIKKDEKKLSKEYQDYWSDKHGRELWSEELANAVALYGAELLPILESIDQIEDEDFTVSFSTGKEIDVRNFVGTDGMRVKDDTLETYKPIYSMAVYRRLNELMRLAGLGLETESETKPAQI